MTLRRQLLIIVLITLSLPWAGCQYARHIEGVLRNTQLETLEVLATTAVAQLSPELHAAASDPVAVYAFTLSAAPILDGYDDEWQLLKTRQAAANNNDNTEYTLDSELDDPHAAGTTNIETNAKQPSNSDQSRAHVLGGVYQNSLYLFIDINDENIVYFNPTLQGANGDRLTLRFGNSQAANREILLSTSAPGKITNSAMQHAAIQGYLQENDSGYQIELIIPLANLSQSGTESPQLEITRYDTDTDSELKSTLVAGRVLLQDTHINKLLAFYADSSRRVQLVDHEGWIIASSGTLSSNPDRDKSSDQDQLDDENLWLHLWESIRLQIYRWMLSEDSRQRSAYADRSSGKYQTGFMPDVLAGNTLRVWQQQHPGDARSIVAVPIFTNDSAAANSDYRKVKGAIIIEQASDAILSTGNAAISKLFNVSIAAIALISAALLIFASLLSWRIKRLAKATNAMINSDGEFNPQFADSSSRDEIGDLYRSFLSMQQRIESYTNYLKSLAAKLSHELRTPLAMVATSLENLQQTQKLDTATQVYMQRANDGIQRLRQLVNAMSAATHIEQSISSAEKEHFDLAALLKNLTDSYRGLDHDKQLQLEISASPMDYYGAPELLAQLIDKLWDNALEFTPAKGCIRFDLSADQENIYLNVSNDGPLLPEAMQKQLFDSLVSIREHKSEQAHLGLGLHIAKLIAEFHQGTIQASNRQDQSGVCFELTLPR